MSFYIPNPRCIAFGHNFGAWERWTDGMRRFCSRCPIVDRP